MDESFRSLIQQKLEVIAREEDAELTASMTTIWGRVDPSPHCPWVGELMQSVNRTCYQSIVTRGARVALTLAKTLANLKPRYEKNLAAELKALVDPFFPEDLYLAPAINTRGVYQRRGDPRKFDDSAYEHALVLARVGSANGSRDAKHKAHLAIDEYELAAKNDRCSAGKRFLESLQLKPNFFGLGIDLKALFSRNKKSGS